MIVYVEGPDNVGKGTQINNIWKEHAKRRMIPYWVHYAAFGIKDSRQCYDFSKVAYEAMFQTAEALWRLNINPIFDRAHLGEWVYGYIYRDYQAALCWEIERQARLIYPTSWQQSHLIVFTDLPENLLDRDDGLSFSMDLTMKTREVERFEDAYERSIIPNKILIDISDKDEDFVWAIIKEFLYGKR